MKRVLVAMSGGVDSSVSAVLLKNSGYYCVGVTVIMDSSKKTDFVDDAKKVCENIGIEHIVFDYSAEFEKEIISNFVKSYEKGETPNPCVLCNRKIKFGKLLRQALSLDFDYLATGHYAKITYSEFDGIWQLKKAANIEKDQSYFLYKLTQDQLKHIIFPLQNIKDKIYVKKIAEENGLEVSKKKESQDICFVGNEKFSSYIGKKSFNSYPGNFIDSYGNVLGKHKGLIYYTVGQRKGLGISFKEPMFVKNIDYNNNEIVLAPEKEIYSDRLIAKDINFIYVKDLYKKTYLLAKIRYRAKEVGAFVIQKEDILEIEFKIPQRAPAKGQAVVLYDEDTVIGGGTIC